ncbi:Isoleucine--tRNA ligase [Gossypium arboreum]|uniref:Isoleucine--tRNA ligase n=1 Tax=Gossypium arboreum TaxID=29729 RepID=A0A0B0NSW9_GOSAR|nr:Isoleucine--tRNA ligase [Gossypium arboreum]
MSMVVGELESQVMGRKLHPTINMVRLVMREEVGKTHLKKKIELLKGSGLVHLKEGTVMIGNQDMIGTYLGRRTWAMVMIGQKEGTEMIETLVENVIESALEIVTVIVIGSVIEIGIGIDIGKTETDMQIIVGTGTVSQSMMMIGTGDGHHGLTASPDCHKKMSIAQDLEMLIMGRGHGLPQSDLSEISYIRNFLVENSKRKKKRSVTAETSLGSLFSFAVSLNWWYVVINS